MRSEGLGESVSELMIKKMQETVQYTVLSCLGVLPFVHVVF